MSDKQKKLVFTLKKDLIRLVVVLLAAFQRDGGGAGARSEGCRVGVIACGGADILHV